MMAMPSSEFTQWLAYHAVVPFDDLKEDARMALLRSTILAASPRQFRSTDPKKLMPVWEMSPAQSTPSQSLIQRMAEGLRGLKKQMGK
jgi:alpha-D-ribose 1-methylphosphonate 5-triphosphate synthase subunit PhnH